MASNLNMRMGRIWSRKVMAFLRRDMLLQTSYRFAFFLNMVVIVFGVAAYYFLSRMVHTADLPEFRDYGSGYFSFILIGIACYNYMTVALGTFAGGIRQAQIFGTLEAMILTRTSLTSIVILSSLWAFISTMFQIFLYILVGWTIFGFDISRINIAATLFMLVLLAFSFSPLGILAAAFVLAFKRGDPVFLAIGGLSALLGGVYYPTSVLPAWLIPLSAFLPITKAVEGLRKAIAFGATIGDLHAEVFSLLMLTALLYPLALYSFNRAILRAKMNGTLSQF